MTDWIHFTPWTSLAGGVLVGTGTALLLLMNGRVAGVSGILGGLLRPRASDIGWRATFLLGLMASPLLYQLFRPLPAVQIEASTMELIAAGLLVGLGTRYGSGCTSGHGVCGLSRLSRRSLVATITFMAAGFVTVFVVRNLLA